MVKHPADYPWSSYRCNAMGEANTLIIPHDCWLLLGNNDEARMAAYRTLFNERLDLPDIDCIRQSVDTGLPTRNDRFRREIEQALSIRLGHGKRGRPSKSKD
jgi:putative transposase